jgi:tetratricopeptide (TPR) repeat protein
VLTWREARLGPDAPDTLAALRRLEGLYRRAGRWADDEAVLRELVQRTTKRFGPDHPETLGALRDAAFLLFNTNRLSEAAGAYERLRGAETAKYAAGAPATLGTLNMLATVYHYAGRLEDADRAAHEHLALSQKHNGPDSPGTGQALALLGMNLLAQGRCAEAEPVLRQAVQLVDKHPNAAWQRGRIRNMHGAALAGVGKPEEGERLLVDGYAAMEREAAKIPAPWKRYLAAAGERVVRFYEATNQPDKARAWRAKLPPPPPANRDP